MWLLDESPSLVRIYDVLYRLGITANSTGFFYVSYAVWLSSRQPDRLLLVTKWLYPEVAKHYDTNWKAVERSIRTVVDAAWRNDPRLLSELAGRPLHEKPRPAQFLAILAKEAEPWRNITSL